MALAKSFRDLDVYRLALRQAKRIFEVTKGFPREEMYSLHDLDDEWHHVGAMLNNMIKRAPEFCQTS